MSTPVGHHKIYFLTPIFMAKTLLLLVVVAAISALQYLGITIIIDSMDTVPLWAVILSTGLVANSITAVLFSAITGIEQKLEIADLRIRVLKAEVNPIEKLIELMTLKHKHDVERAAVGIKDKESPDPSADIGAEKPSEEGNTTDNGIIFEELNPRTKKPYKRSFAERQALREKALKREQEKRIKKTAEESKKRKARK